MAYPTTNDISYEEIQNGALVLLLLREANTWEELCKRYAYSDPSDFNINTTSMALLRKLADMRDLGLISFEEEETERGKKPIGEIKDTGLWATIRVDLGGMSLTEVVQLSRHAKGIAVTPVFGRPDPLPPNQRMDVFVLMPFEAKLEKVKKMCQDLGVTIRRANEIFSPEPFIRKVWNGICAAKLILADCTENNPNVFYEIGMAHTAGKKVVLITRSEADVPADIKPFDYIPYIYDPEGVENLIGRLKEFFASELLGS